MKGWRNGKRKRGGRGKEYVQGVKIGASRIWGCSSFCVLMCSCTSHLIENQLTTIRQILVGTSLPDTPELCGMGFNDHTTGQNKKDGETGRLEERVKCLAFYPFPRSPCLPSAHFETKCPVVYLTILVPCKWVEIQTVTSYQLPNAEPVTLNKLSAA